MTKLEQSNKKQELREFNAEINRVIAAIEENIRKNTIIFNSASRDLPQKKIYADFIRVDKQKVAILENAKKNHQTDTPEVQAILKQYPITNQPAIENQQSQSKGPEIGPVALNNFSNLTGLFKNFRERYFTQNHSFQKNTTLNQKIDSAIECAQVEMEKLSTSIAKLENHKKAGIYDPTGRVQQEINTQMAQKLSIVEDVKKLLNYQGDPASKAEIMQICNAYKKEPLDTPSPQTPGSRF